MAGVKRPRTYTKVLRAAAEEATRERIALAVAERRGDSYSIAQHARTARAAGLGIDEVTLARRFQLVKLDEPSVETTHTMLRGLRATYE